VETRKDSWCICHSSEMVRQWDTLKDSCVYLSGML
jgi:hypothetical protein